MADGGSGGDNRNGKRSEIDAFQKLVIRVSYFVTGVWGVSFLLDVIDRDYEAPQSVHAVMLIMAGALFGGGIAAGIARRNGHDRVDNDRDREG